MWLINSCFAPATARPGFKTQEIMIIHAADIQLDTFVLKSMDLFSRRALIIIRYYHTYDEEIGELRLSFSTNMDAWNFYEKVKKAIKDDKEELFINDITPKFDKEKYLEYVEEEMQFCDFEEQLIFD